MNIYCFVFCQKVDPFELEDIKVLHTYVNGRPLNITDKVVHVPHKKPQWVLSCHARKTRSFKNLLLDYHVKEYSRS